MLVGHLCISFEEMPLQLFCPLQKKQNKTGFLGFDLWELFIYSDTNPSLDKWFTKIVSISELPFHC